MKNSLKSIINGVKMWVMDNLDFNKLKNKPFYEDVENNVIIPMDKKFLPEHQHSWEKLEDKPFYNYEEVLFESDSVTSKYHTWEMGSYKFVPHLDFKVGENICVNLNGTIYEKTVVDFVEQSTGENHLGLDFTYEFSLGQCGVFADNLNIDLTNAYVKIYRKHLKQIDEKFIPTHIGDEFIISITSNGDGTYIADKTDKEIIEAYASNKILACRYQEDYFYYTTTSSVMNSASLYFVNVNTIRSGGTCVVRQFAYEGDYDLSNGNWFYCETEFESLESYIYSLNTNDKTIVGAINEVSNEVANLKENGIGSGGSSEKELLVRYVHSGNQELYIESIDYATGVITFTEPHGLTKQTNAMVVGNVDPFGDTPTRVKCFNGVPYEYRIVHKSHLIPIDEYTATYCDVTSIDTNNKFNQSLDYSLWHFEIPIKWTIDNIDLVKEVKNVDILIEGYIDHGNMYLQQHFYMEDNTVKNQYVQMVADNSTTTNHKKPLYSYATFKTKIDGNLLLMGLSDLKRVMNHGSSHGFALIGSYGGNTIGLQFPLLVRETKNFKCLKSVGNFVGYFGIANGSVVKIYEGDVI